MKLQKLLQKKSLDLRINWAKVAHKSRILSNLLRQYNNDYSFDKKDDNHLLIEAVVSFFNDFNYRFSFQNIQKILSKPQPQNRLENLVHRVAKLFKQSHNLSSQYILRVYESILHEIYALQQTKTTVLPNHLFTLFAKINDDFFNTISFEPNLQDLDNLFLPLVNVQIVNLEIFNILNLEQANSPFRKIITMWYLNNNQKFLSSYYYQKSIDLVSAQYNAIFFEAKQTQNYDKLVNFVFDALNKFVISDQYKNRVLQTLFNKYKILFPKHQIHFLFIIIYFNLNKFDWKQFQKVANLAVTKQHIIRNLNIFVKNHLLKSKIFQKRKFYFQSVLLKNVLMKNHKTSYLEEALF